MNVSKVDEIFERFEKSRESIEIPLESIKENLQEYADSIVLYGAGSAGIAFLNYLRDAGIMPVYFSDADTDKWGMFCEGLEIIPPMEIIRRVGENALVIVTINTDGKTYCKDFKKELLIGGHQGVHANLKKYGCERIIDYTFFRRCYALFYGEQYNLPACSDIQIMLENRENIKQVYELLSDAESKDTFLKILEFRLISDETDIPVYPEKGMYFEYDLFERRNNEVFIDCGACGGSSLKEFLEYNFHQFEAYFGIEPDKKNYIELEQFINKLEYREQRKIHILNAAAYSHRKGEHFFVLNGPGTFQAETGPKIVPTDTIDCILQGKRASYIKMNIEGSEIAALKGAENTIKTYMPRLGIMGYHKTSDLWKVPLLIKKYNNDYRISLRSYMKNVAFIYYAY